MSLIRSKSHFMWRWIWTRAATAARSWPTISTAPTCISPTTMSRSWWSAWLLNRLDAYWKRMGWRFPVCVIIRQRTPTATITSRSRGEAREGPDLLQRRNDRRGLELPGLSVSTRTRRARTHHTRRPTRGRRPSDSARTPSLTSRRGLQRETKIMDWVSVTTSTAAPEHDPRATRSLASQRHSAWAHGRPMRRSSVVGSVAPEHVGTKALSEMRS